MGVLVANARSLNGNEGRRLGIVVALIAALLVLTAAPAQAYTSYYVYQESVPENSVRYSGTHSSISYGEVDAFPINIEGASIRTYVETYYDYPGYSTIASAYGGSTVTIYHTRKSDVNQKCYWYWPYWGGSIGSNEMTCLLKS